MNVARDPMDRRVVLERALQAVEDMQRKLDALQREKKEPIAIVGMGCRFPGEATDPEAYWKLLHDGVAQVLVADDPEALTGRQRLKPLDRFLDHAPGAVEGQ